MAGRHIKPPKGTNDLYDAGRGHVYAEKIQPLPDNMKKKISVILEAIPTKSKSEIAEVLQACDYDVDSALNCFIADGEMEAQNEWTVQEKRKNKKKKKSAKKPVKEESQNGAENPESGSKTEGLQKNIPNGTVSKGHAANTDKSIAASKNTPKSLENTKPISSNDPEPATNDSLKPIAINDQKHVVNDPQPTSSPPLSPMLMSPTDSVSSSQDSQSFNKARPGSSAKEKHPRVRTSSTSKPEVIKRSLKDLERSAVSIARFQSILDEHADSSTKALVKSFQEIRQALDERERILGEKLQSVIEESKKLLEDRQEDAACLKFKCNRVGCMSEEESTELRSEIKHFVGERRIDEDLGKTTRFTSDQGKMLEVIKTFGEVPAIRNRYTPFKRKQPEPAKPHKPPPPKSHKPTPTTKSTTPPTNVPTPVTTAGHTKSKPPAGETKVGTSGNDRPPLSPTRLKDQAEMHARLQQAVREHQVPPATKEASKKPEIKVNEKPKAKDFGPKPFRSNSGKGQQGNSHREQMPQRQRQVNSAQQTSRSFNNNRHESKPTPPAGENSKEETKPQADRANSGVDESPAGNATRAADVESADGGTLAPEGSQDGNTTQTREDKTQQPQEQKPAENGASHTTAHDLNGHVITANDGHKKPRRRYIRKTPINNDGPFFRNGTSETSNGSGSTKGNGDHNKNEKDVPNGQFKGEAANGNIGFVPLPQRNRRQRKIYYKREPGTKIEFPPKRESGEN